MISIETDNVWATATEVNIVTSNTVDGSASSVSCDSSGDCTVTGFALEVDDTTETLTYDEFVTSETAGSGTWSTPVVLATGLSSSVLVEPTAISCVDATDCTITSVALDLDTFTATADLETEVAGTWSPATGIANAGTRPVEFSGITCSAVGDCVAVGSSSSSSNLLDDSTVVPAVAIESSGVWGGSQDLTLPLVSPVTNQGELEGVSCYAVGECVAVGQALELPKDQLTVGIAVSLSGTSWGRVGVDPTVVHAGSSVATSSNLIAPVCYSATECFAIGVAQDGDLDSFNNEYGYTTSILMTGSLSVPGRPGGVKVTPTTVRTTISFSPPDHRRGTAHHAVHGDRHECQRAHQDVRLDRSQLHHQGPRNGSRVLGHRGREELQGCLETVEGVTFRAP